MGCGQSKIGIYQRKSKSKKNGSKRSAEEGEKEEDAEEAEEVGKCESNEPGEEDKREEDLAVKVKQVAQQPAGGPVSAQSDISSSQLDFFKMLDEKIENGPDYEDSDEEEQKARMANLVEEWRAACTARQQKKSKEPETWMSPARGAKPYQEDFESYAVRRMNAVDTQRFPTGYSPCPPSNTIAVHLHNSFRMSGPSFAEQARMQPRMPLPGGYHPFHPPSELYNHCEEPTNHPLSGNDPSNPLRANYSQVLLRQSSINSQLQHYPESQRLYSENARQFPDYPRPYQTPRAMPTGNILHEHRIYAQDVTSRSYQIHPDDPRQPEEVQRIMMELPRAYHEPQRQEPSRPLFGNLENQRGYHERLKEKQRQYSEGPRMPPPFQRPPLLTQRSVQEPPRIYRDMENENHCFPRQERFLEGAQDGSTSRISNSNPFKMGRSASVDVQYVAGPPPPREVIPLQGAPGPPQGSPRPLVARGLQNNMHRLPANSVVHFRKPQGAFT